MEKPDRPADTPRPKTFANTSDEIRCPHSAHRWIEAKRPRKTMPTPPGAYGTPPSLQRNRKRRAATVHSG